MTATATATPELKIEPKLPVLSFNFEQLKAWATSLTERYANMVVTEEAIADVKRDMADINRAKKIVDDSRKEAVRRVSEPIRIFEGQIKEVCAIFDTAYSKLGEQVKTFEDTQREEKRNHVQRCFDVRDAKFAAVAVLATPKAVADWLTANLATDWPE